MSEACADETEGTTESEAADVKAVESGLGGRPPGWAPQFSILAVNLEQVTQLLCTQISLT